MNNIEILRSGFSDSLDILKTEEMDFICGGDTDCKKNYSLSLIPQHFDLTLFISS